MTKQTKSEAEAESLDDALCVFVGNAKLRYENVYVGIDPGTSGALAFLCGPLWAVVDMPVVTVARSRAVAIKYEKGQDSTGLPKTKTVHGETQKFDLLAIVRLFRRLRPFAKDSRIVVALEIAQPMIRGPKKKGSANTRTAYQTGMGYYMWPLFVLAKKGYVLEERHPSAWKKAMQLLRGDKNAMRMRASHLWPDAPLARTKDHGRAEALLLAESVRRDRGDDNTEGNKWKTKE